MSVLKHSNKALHIRSEDPANLQKLDNIYAPFPALVFGHKRLGTAELFGQLRLRKTCRLSRCNKPLAELFVDR